VVLRIELNGLLVFLDGALDVDLDGLVALVRQVDGLDVIAAATGNRDERSANQTNLQELLECHREHSSM
jgi:hypothetical protein